MKKLNNKKVLQPTKALQNKKQSLLNCYFTQLLHEIV